MKTRGDPDMKTIRSNHHGNARVTLGHGGEPAAMTLKVLEEGVDPHDLKDRLVLRSLYEYKKKKVRYFGPAFEKWKRLNYD